MMAGSLDPKYEQTAGRVGRLCEAFRIDTLGPQLLAIGENLKEGDTITVAVLGGFKAGKSSFINTVLGRDLMPVAVLPVTAVITSVRYGSQDRAEVIYLEGRTESIGLGRIAEFIAEQHNPDNEKRVARVKIETAALRKVATLQFIDTPGVGSVFIHNTLASREWLPRAEAALLAVSVDHPLSEEDLLLLKELEKYTSEITILVTKADLVLPGELQQVIDFIHSQTQRRLGKNFRILPFSTRPGFECARQAVMDYLEKSIAAESSRKAGEIVLHKLRTLLAGLEDYLRLALAAATAADESRQALQEQLKQEQGFSSAIQNEIRVIVTDLKTRLRIDAGQCFQRACGETLSRLTDDLRPRLRQWKGNLDKTSRAFREWAEVRVGDQMRRISGREGPTLAKRHLDEAQASLSRMVRAFQDRLSQSIEKALGMRFSGAQFEAGIETPRHPDVQIGKIFDTSWEVIWFLIPMGLFRPLFNRHFLNLLPWETEKNLSRLASQWSETIYRSIDDLSRQAVEFIRNEIATVENVLAKAEDRRDEIEKALAEVKALANGLAG